MAKRAPEQALGVTFNTKVQAEVQILASWLTRQLGPRDYRVDVFTHNSGRRDHHFGDMILGDWETEPLEAACDEADDAAVDATAAEILLDRVREAFMAWRNRPKEATSRLWAKLNEPQSDATQSTGPWTKL